MSGGHFDYKQYAMEDIADTIKQLIETNEDVFSEETLVKFRETEHTVRQAAEMIQRVDWLISGDDGEDTFHERWEKEVRPYWNAGIGSVRLTCGDKVKVCRRVTEEEESSWCDVWTNEMNNYIGECGTVVNNDEGELIFVKFNDSRYFCFPNYVLKKV